MPRATKAADPAKQAGEPVPSKAKGGRATKGAAPATVGDDAAPVTKEPEAAAAGPARPAGKATTKSASSKAALRPTGKEAPKKSARQHGPAEATKASSPSAEPKGSTDKFLDEQKALLLEERIAYEEQAAALKAQAEQMALEMEPGDIQFDDESGEGGTANIDRERDLALSAQARLAVDEIDHALAKIANGTYGACEGCGQPILRDRLQALPQARLCVACKSGGLSRR